MCFKGGYIEVLGGLRGKEVFGWSDRRSTVGDTVNFLKSRNDCMCCLVKGMAAGTRLSEYKEGQVCRVVQHV